MLSQKFSMFSGAVLWFGAAISLAEILTGMQLASLGIVKGIIAILFGHTIGCILLFGAGYIGAQEKLSAMETTALSFGKQGAYLFSGLNVLQLIGWTAVMLQTGAMACVTLFPESSFSLWVFCLGFGIFIWIFIGLSRLVLLNTLSVLLLLILSAWALFKISFGEITAAFDFSLNFGLALELSIIMPLSWLPLIADYTKQSAKPFKFTLASTLSYFIGSCIMYILGLLGAIYTHSFEIVSFFSAIGFGAVGLIIIVFSTITTGFLDVHSGAESARFFSKKIPLKLFSFCVLILGLALALFVSEERYASFLYFIGSVFIPMASILLTDYFIIKHKHSATWLNKKNMVIWLMGFIAYQILLRAELSIGSSIPVIILTGFCCIISSKINMILLKKK